MSSIQIVEPALTANALEVLTARYLRRGPDGTPTETPGALLARVAEAVARPEARYGGDADGFARRLHRAMVRLEFLPNSPTLMNAGGPVPQLAACFVLPLEDNLGSIFTALRNAALIHQTGGGVGYDFSPLRPRGDPITSAGGVSSGPVSFMKVFDASSEALRQGGRRRAAAMAVLSVYHPDIEEFITAKRDPGSLGNFNLSVACDSAFMAASSTGSAIALVNPRTAQEAGRRNASELLDLLAACAWETGEPGIVFVDRINRDNPTPAAGRITATNPCGEVPLLPYEACVLGSINVASLTRTGRIDWVRLGELVELGVRCLDNCIDASRFPVPEIAAAAAANRKIGLGIMGWADALVDLGIPYDDDAAIRIAGEVMGFIGRRAAAASQTLAAERGSFPNFAGSVCARSGIPIRNATRTAIAPTGTLSLIAGCSSGIEPLYALAYRRRILDDRVFVHVNERFEAHARAAGVWDAIEARVLERGRVRDDPSVPDSLRRVFPTAADIGPAWHVRTQAAFQEHVDNAVSKTVNLSERATQTDVRATFEMAYSQGCKGITVYRQGSRAREVLSALGGRTGACPDCGVELEFAEGSSLCRICGFTHGT